MHHSLFTGSQDILRKELRSLPPLQLGRSYPLLITTHHTTHLIVIVCLHCCSQAAKTYLEKNFEAFPPCSLDELIQHGLKALAGSLSDGELTPANTTVRVCVCAE